MSEQNNISVTTDPKCEGTIYDSDRYYLTKAQKEELNNHGSVTVQLGQNKKNMNLAFQEVKNVIIKYK